MKTIIISIRPVWVAKILNGEKIIELRKSMPSELPCRVLVYCTKSNDYLLNFDLLQNKETEWAVYPKKFVEETNSHRAIINGTNTGKIVAEFTLNKVEKLDIPYPAYFHEVADKYKHIVDGSLVSLHEMHRYFGTKTGYAWHISNLEIGNVHPWLFFYGLKRAPQSWCYAKK